jgi:ATP-dependent DNA helicase RecQ
MAARYEQKAEADRDNLRRVVLYAQTALCRWKAVLDYFGEMPDWERCDHCDNCERPIAEPTVVADRRLVQPPRSKPEVLPLPPILGAQDPGSLKPGDSLTLPIFGAGEVREASGESLTVAFADGEVREFRR